MGKRTSLHRSPPLLFYARSRSVAFLLIVWHLGRRVDLVARLLVNLGFCRIRFWYPVSSGSGISRETSRIYLWNLTVEVS